MRQRIGKYRRTPTGAADSPSIGCILLAEPFFFQEQDWIPTPSDFSLNIVQGKRYDSEASVGRDLWAAVTQSLAGRATAKIDSGPATIAAIQGDRYGGHSWSAHVSGKARSELS
jgi:putative restriction endonuclease